MDIQERFRRNVRWFYAWIGSVLLLGGAPIAAMNLVDADTTFSRVAGVVIGVGGMVPWAVVVAMMIRHGDEFVRLMHLVALACAFAGTLLLIITLDWLARAEFIEPPELMPIWLAAMVIWVVALLITKRQFERTR